MHPGITSYETYERVAVDVDRDVKSTVYRPEFPSKDPVSQAFDVQLPQLRCGRRQSANKLVGYPSPLFAPPLRLG
jgi:hypothetical protein